MLLIATALLVTANVAMGEPGTAANAVKDECTERKYLANLLTHFSGKLNNLFGTVQALSKQQKQLRLAAEQHAMTKVGMAYTLLEAISSQRLDKAISKQQAATTTVTQLSEQVGSRIGLLLLSRVKAGAATVKYTTPAKEDTTTPAKNGDFSTRCGVHPIVTPPANTKCNTEPADSELNKAGEQIASETKLKFLSATTIKAIPLFASLQAKSTPSTTAPLTANDGCGNNAGGGTNGIAIQGLATVDKTIAHDTIPIETENACKTPKPNSNDDPTETANLVYKVCLAQKADLAMQPALSSETLDELAADTTAQEAALILTGQSTKEQDANKRKAAVANVLGKGKDTVAKKFLEKLTETNVALKLQDDAQPVSIETASGNNFHKALALFTAQAHQRSVPPEKPTNAEGSPKQADSGSKTENKKDGSNTAKPVCCTFQNQTACNNGQNRKWENNTCKDSSFLVKNKFSMMVSAFVSLLEFHLSKDYCSN
ncbi:variant surface glycoprotein (VSG, atypical), putative [Trypanosoma brucei brucei TREU927]|uniref:Variant surface glycoprotein (VSG, atypical), putative n=1 Tax=Trypanosoma brucei brucei (strain 927/4 GUTat10.1) TaxID=185431 RepID=Q57X37_TRYB2|nr:variant surface glycoprotein (VSG, atypical), putative [Trypanosoma brucei brucei TREU927]AAX69824.1 variant surface glycoprotein (VSG, atypical), putative [Trypanosoma brucei]AAZ11578.1 variant surface glycoprotein (VSG, atypical), putative [Trypanosoma brucei brucei TREU927]